MNPNLAFWSLALVNLCVLVACTALGVRRIRARDVRGHRRMMLTAAWLVALFLVSYGVKLVFLGHEDKTGWTRLDFTVLYVHEACVTAMLMGGALALYRARRFRGRLGASWQLPPESDPLKGRRGHRRAGWTAITGAALAFVTAAGVLAGMFGRAGWFGG